MHNTVDDHMHRDFSSRQRGPSWNIPSPRVLPDGLPAVLAHGGLERVRLRGGEGQSSTTCAQHCWSEDRRACGPRATSTTNSAAKTPNSNSTKQHQHPRASTPETWSRQKGPCQRAWGQKQQQRLLCEVSPQGPSPGAQRRQMMATPQPRCAETRQRPGWQRRLPLLTAGPRGCPQQGLQWHHGAPPLQVHRPLHD